MRNGIHIHMQEPLSIDRLPPHEIRVLPNGARAAEYICKLLDNLNPDKYLRIDCTYPRKSCLGDLLLLGAEHHPRVSKVNSIVCFCDHIHHAHIVFAPFYNVTTVIVDNLCSDQLPNAKDWPFLTHLACTNKTRLKILPYWPGVKLIIIHNNVIMPFYGTAIIKRIKNPSLFSTCIKVYWAARLRAIIAHWRKFVRHR